MVGGRTEMRIQVERVKQEKRIRENADIVAMVICLCAAVYVGGHLVWWAIR